MGRSNPITKGPLPYLKKFLLTSLNEANFIPFKKKNPVNCATCTILLMAARINTNKKPNIDQNKLVLNEPKYVMSIEVGNAKIIVRMAINGENTKNKSSVKFQFVVVPFDFT